MDTAASLSTNTVQSAIAAWWNGIVAATADPRLQAIGLAAALILAVAGIAMLIVQRLRRAAAARAVVERLAADRAREARIGETQNMLGHELGELKGRLVAPRPVLSVRFNTSKGI